MDSLKKWIFPICSALILDACASLKVPVIVKNAPVEPFRYVFILPTQTVISSPGNTYGESCGMSGLSATESLNPKDVITGILIRKGYVILPEIKPELTRETLLVNYGENGRRSRGLGYTTEVTIRFISAGTRQTVYSCTAEGEGETETDGIRLAIRRALSGLPFK